VRDAVASAVEAGPGDKRLVAWVDSTLATPPADLHVQLRSLLAAKLPEYMIPSVIAVLPALPRTANGKIDRKSLPAPAFAAVAHERVFTPAETPQQTKLAEIWADVLKLESVSITDSIFELGADSLLIFRISARANREGLPIQPAQIFQHRTIANLSSILGNAKNSGAESITTGPAIPKASRDQFRRRNA